MNIITKRQFLMFLKAKACKPKRIKYAKALARKKNVRALWESIVRLAKRDLPFGTGNRKYFDRILDARSDLCWMMSEMLLHDDDVYGCPLGDYWTVPPWEVMVEAFHNHSHHSQGCTRCARVQSWVHGERRLRLVPNLG